MNIWNRTVEEQDAEIARVKSKMKEQCAQVADEYDDEQLLPEERRIIKVIAAAIRALKDRP